MSAYLMTIQEQIEELNPKEYRRMQATGELDKALEEYREQVMGARRAAARGARKRADPDDPRGPAAAMNMAAMMAQEIEMASIMEELEYLYGPQTTESPTPTSMDIKNLIILSPGEKVPEGYVRLSDMTAPIFDPEQAENEAIADLFKERKARREAAEKGADKP